MATPDIAQLLRGLLDERTRLYRLQAADAASPLAQLAVERWQQTDALDAPCVLQLDALAPDARLDVQAMLGQRVCLLTRLSGGDEHARPGIVTAATAMDSDGTLARFRLRIEPWIGLLAHSSSSRAWRDKTVTEIVDSLLKTAPHAAWHWAACVPAHLEQSAGQGRRSWTVQYRESDLAFLQRLLAREGIGWRVEADDGAPAGHRVVFFADSFDKASCPEDASSASVLGGSGIRFHRAASQEEQDSIQAFGGLRRLQAGRVVTLAWDSKAKRSFAAEADATPAQPAATGVEHYSVHNHHVAEAHADAAAAQRAAHLMQQSLQAQRKRFIGHGTVRTFSAGTRFVLAESDLLGAGAALDSGDEAAESNPARNGFLLTRVQSLGVNNLPKALAEHIARTLGAAEPIDAEPIDAVPAADGAAGDADADVLADAALQAAVRTQAAASGYANHFEAIRAAVPWRPRATLHAPARVAPGMLTATVVGPDGGTGGGTGAGTGTAGAEPVHMDALGRIRVRFDFQDIQPDTEGAVAQASIWVRVLQRWAGAGMGAQFIPRLGQQVLVGFSNGDIERPVVLGSLHDGRGEGGVPATPGGQASDSDASAVFKHSTDAAPSAQGNRSGGRSPAWHGHSPQALAAGGQANAAALSGYKSSEFGGTGYNQLVFDDSNSQLRVQLATTQHGSQLNLGHLIHQADNHRGSLRGLGFELRTDAYAAVRAAQGVLVSTFATQASEPAGDAAAGIALQGQLEQIAKTLSDAAGRHQATRLASQIGSVKPGGSRADAGQPPAKAMLTALKGMLSENSVEAAQADAQAKATGAAQDKLPHLGDPLVVLAARGGQATVAGLDLQLAAGETLHLAAGADMNLATGGVARVHSGQSIGLLAGAQAPGTESAGKGITLIAAQGDVQVQAQAGPLQLAALKDLAIQSKSAHVDWAAAKKITLRTAAGASVTIEGGGIVVECPGKITVRASKKSFVGAERSSYPLPILPSNVCLECLAKRAAQRSAFVNKGS